MYYRKRNRLKEYDYSSAGGYFLTICSAKKKCIFWEEKEWNKKHWKEATLSQLGETVDNELKKWDDLYKGVKIDKYVIMPNHIHIIVIISSPVEANCVRLTDELAKKDPDISRMVKQFKGAISKQIGKSIWQRSFYDHILRDENDYKRIWEYIENNPYGCIEVDYDWLEKDI